MGQAYEYITPWEKKTHSTSEVTGKQSRELLPFNDAVVFHIVNRISQESKIRLSVIAVDYVFLTSRVMGYNPWDILENTSRIFSKVGTICALKFYFIGKAFGNFKGNYLYVLLTNWLSDIVLILLLCTCIEAQTQGK